MKKSFYYFLQYVGFAIALVLAANPMQAQERELDLPNTPPSVNRLFFNEPRGYWTLGLNGGFSYQSADVRNQFDGWGLGLTLAKNYIHIKNGLLDFDIRGRALYANSTGLAATPSTGIKFNTAVNGTNNTTANYLADTSYFANYRNNMFELGLEGVFTFNRLREQSGILLQLYGGAGANWHLVHVNQLDANGAKYNYRNINTQQSLTAVRNDVRSLLDNTYETKADGMTDAGQLTLAPYFGVELGFHVTPKFMISLGHKLTFTQTNVFDGQQWNNNNVLLSGQDLHHYTSLDLKWILNARARTQKPKSPTVTIYEPSNDPHITNRPNEVVKARVTNIQTGVDRLTMTVNGRNNNFTFYNGELLADIALQLGTNEVIIRAQNSVGTAEDRTVIIYRLEGNNPTPPNPNNNPTPPPPAEPLPTVRITTPRNGASIDYPTQRVIATVTNIGDNGNVNVTVNGQNFGNVFVTNNEIAQDVQLVEGANRIIVTARNRSGNASDEVTVYYRRPQPQVPLPTVRIVRPTNNAEFEYADVSFTADVRNVNNRNDINITLNGRTISNFDFSTDEVNLRLQLADGTNRIAIVARNATGSANDAVTVYYRRSTPRVSPPSVRITQLSDAQGNDLGCTTNLIATTTNVENYNQISITLNGRSVTNFTFDANRQQISSSLPLASGNNAVSIVVRNSEGNARDDRNATCTVIRELPKTPPTVRITDPAKNATVSTPNLALRATITNVPSRDRLRLTLNGQPISFTYFAGNQTLTASLNLNEGANEIYLRGENNDGVAEDRTTVIYKKEVIIPRPPKVTISQPSNNSSVNDPTVNLRAFLVNIADSRGVEMTVNGQRFENFRLDKSGANLTARVDNLREGQNIITIVVTNREGSDRASVNVLYEKRKTPPSVRIVTPANNSTISESSTEVRASINHINDAQGIRMTVNGQPFTAFQYGNGTLNARVNNLLEGQNTISIEVNNADGSNRDNTTFTYTRAKTPPSVKFTNLSNSTIEQAEIGIQATARRVLNRNDIKLYVNGTPINFDFSPANGNVRSSTALRPGPNDLKITVQNADGTAEDRVVITRITTPPPTVAFTTPASPGLKVPTTNFNVRAITNVRNAQDIKLTLNGVAISNFTLNNGEISASVVLSRGSNEFVLTASNSAGNASATTIVISERVIIRPNNPTKDPANDTKEPQNDVQKPVITTFDVTRPLLDPMNPTVTAQSVLTVKLQHVQNASQIELIINGIVIRNSNFEVTTGILTHTFTVKSGSYQIQIKASNSAGNVEQSKTFTF